MDMGYTPEIIGTHYIIQSETSNKIYDLNSRLALERGVESNTKHQYTQEYIDDFQVREDITRKCDRILLDFIIKFMNDNQFRFMRAAKTLPAAMEASLE